MEKIGELADFPEGQATPIDVNGINIAVFNVNGELHAILNNCPHQNLPLHYIGKRKYNSDEILGDINQNEDGSCTISCPWHNLDIDLDTGESNISGVKTSSFDVFIENEEVMVDI